MIITSVVFALTAIGAADQPLKPRSTVANDSRTTQQSGLLKKEQAKEIWIGNVLFDDDTLT